MPSHQFALLLEYLQKFTLVKAKVKESSQALNYLKDPLSNITLTAENGEHFPQVITYDTTTKEQATSF